MRLYFFVFSFLLLATQAVGQTAKYEYFITLNGNLYLPINNPEKGVYPILGYDKETDSKVLIGGMGVGLAAFKSVKNNLMLKGQANLSKHTYWDEPLYIVDDVGNPLNRLVAGSSDYAIGLTVSVNYFLTPKISVGTGLGTQILLVSLSRLPQVYDSKKLVAVNNYYKRFVPVLPIELSYKSNKKLFNVRYEHGLLDRLKGDLQNVQDDKFGLLVFEVGFRIR
ncbi:hypothetical protein AAE02nite_03300 [Adhaeribacter aerolatus]|uniref:Outer membrane protein beta-barrel domain-containing protein n=1 Tax=Adhaeribacter aerolatus TaxID=670289 RepID=A0A512ASI5_9BACT|nr:hypothetical protein [Adhaeribacter aerolatus]GEO02666.1 hypothetical protein AAE02nite_03300 [Adhaeribacter aerolatus]